MSCWRQPPVGDFHSLADASALQIDNVCLTFGRFPQADLEAQGQDAWGGRVLLLPTVIMNDNQYRGRLDTPSIVRGLCSGFQENTEPEVRTLHAGPLAQIFQTPTFSSHHFRSSEMQGFPCMLTE